MIIYRFICGQTISGISHTYLKINETAQKPEIEADTIPCLKTRRVKSLASKDGLK